MSQQLNTLACHTPILDVYTDQTFKDILYTFPVTSYSVQKVINNITHFSVRLAAGNSIKDPKTTYTPYDLYSRYMKHNQLQPVVLSQQIDKRTVVLTQGYITNINPSLSSDSQGTVAAYNIGIQDQIMKLKLTPLSSFVYANAATINDNRQNVNTININRNLSAVGQGGASIFTPVNNPLNALSLTQKTSILDATAQTISYLMQLSMGIIIDQNNRPYKNSIIDIRNYIEGTFYLCDHYVAGSAAAPYIRQLQNMLVSGLMRGSIWQSLTTCLCGTDRLCQIIPAPFRVQNKTLKPVGGSQGQAQEPKAPMYKLAPACIIPGKSDSTTKLQGNRLSAITGITNPADLINRPQLFYVSYQDLNYSAGKDIVQTDLAGARWGKYIPPQAEARLKQAGKDGTSQLFKRTLRPAPTWLNLLSTSKFSTDTITLESPSVSTQPIGQATSQIVNGVIQATKVQPLYDNYAKALFCALYKGNDSAAIGLLPTLQNLMLDQKIGQCVQIDVKVNKNQQSNSAMDIHFLGALYSYSLSYSVTRGFSLQAGIRFIRDPQDASAVASPLYSATPKGPSFDSQRPAIQTKQV